MSSISFTNASDFHLEALFNSRISIWKKGATGVVSSYGIESQAFTLLASDIPCCVQPGGGKELDSDTAFGVQKYMFFMRPLLVDDPAIAITLHHWLQINASTARFAGNLIVNPPDANGTMFDILNVSNPMLLDHHLEIETKLIEP